MRKVESFRELEINDPTDQGQPSMADMSETFSDALAGVRALGLPLAGGHEELAEERSMRAAEPTRSRLGALSPALGVLAMAVIARLVVLLFVPGPRIDGLGWYLDAMHHWQIAFLSKDIGFSQGFLRLWDFKGLEYFWGFAHPVLTAALFTITGSIDVLVPRMLGLVTGSIAVLFLFLLVKRYFGTPAALIAAAFMALNPVVIVADTAGIQEPIGLMFLFSGLYLWPKHPIWAGLLLGLAGLVRAEYWVFGLGLCIVSFIVDRREYKNHALVLGWLIPSLAYMKYLSVYTGNPIYPVYWYFRGNAAGEWIANDPLSSTEIGVVWVARLLLPVFAFAAVAVIRKRPRYSIFALLGLGEMIFLCIVFGFSAYTNGFTFRILFDRVFMMPHIYLGVLVGAVLLRPRVTKQGLRVPSWARLALAGVFVIAGQGLWRGVWHYHERWTDFWSDQYQAAAEIANLYQGGVVSIPEDRPDYTYFLARYFGIPATSIHGQMYDAFAYIDEDPFADYSKTEPILRNWLAENDIRLLVTYRSKDSYQEMIRRSPDWFTFAGSMLDDDAVQAYYVHPTTMSPSKSAMEEG